MGLKKITYSMVALTISLLFSSLSNAWVHNPGATIKGITQWEHNSKTLVIFSDDKKCFINNDNKALLSLALSLYMSNNRVGYYCHEAKVSTGGFESHKLHRLDARL